MTERLYYTDSYVTEFSAHIRRVEGERVWLNRTAFYPTSGGQPFDTGRIGTVPVIAVEEDGEDVVHVLASQPALADEELTCSIDRDRRFDHMQQHTGQHLLSAVLARDFGAETVSFHMGPDYATVELAIASLDETTLVEAESRANRLIADNRPVKVSFEDAASVTGLRKPSDRSGTLRIVSIDGLDRSACGGTHVRSTGEIGCVLLRGVERIRGNVRLEFVCGLRAVRRSRAEYSTLGTVARSFSSSLWDTAAAVAAQAEKLAAASKALRQATADLAGYRGRELHSAAAQDESGLRMIVREYPTLDESARIEAQAASSCGRAVVVAWSKDPAALLIAASADSGINAGALLKQAVSARGGRGGGSAQVAQGTVPATSLDEVIAEVTRTVAQR